MIRYGFIRNKEEIKFLILYVMGYMPFPVDFDTIVDLCTWCDEGFGFFELNEAFQELLHTGHLLESTPETTPLYAISEKGRNTVKLFDDRLPYTIKKEAQIYALKTVRKIRRDAELHTGITPAGEDFLVTLGMEDIFSVSLHVVNEKQALTLEQNFREYAEDIYNDFLRALTKERNA